MSDFIIDNLTIFPFTKSEKETLFKESDVINSKIPFSYKKLGEVNIVNYLMDQKDKFKDKFNIQEWITSLEFGLGAIIETTPESFDFIEKVKLLEKETKMQFLGEMLSETIPIENLIQLAFELSPLKIQQSLRSHLKENQNFDENQLIYGLKNCFSKVEEYKDENEKLENLSLYFDINLMKEEKFPFIKHLINLCLIYEEAQIDQHKYSELVDFFYRENLKRNEEYFVIHVNMKEILKDLSLIKKLLSYEKYYFVKTSKKKSHLKLV